MKGPPARGALGASFLLADTCHVDVTAVGGLRLGTVTAVPGGGRPGQQFAVGQDQLLDGTVISIDHDSVVIQVGNQRMAATTDASVRPGDVLRLLVREAGPDQVLMQIVGRGGMPVPQTRTLSRGELAAELTNVGLAPDEQSLQVAGELLARGEPLTAKNVLDVRRALAGVMQGRGAPAEAELNSADLRAAVFLKSQGLPLTPAAIEIVRQAWASRSALGQEVEQLRDGLASIAARLVALAGEEPAAASSAAANVPTSAPPTGAAATRGLQSGAPEPPAPGAQAAPASAQPAPASGQPAPVAVPGPPASGQPALASAQPSPASGQAAPASGQPAPASAPGPASGPAPANRSAEQAMPVQPDEAGPLSVPQNPTPSSGRPAVLASVAAGTVLPEEAAQTEPLAGPAAAGVPTTTPPAAERPLARLLGAVTQTLDQLHLIDDQAVGAPRAELAERIKQVVAEQGTPVEAKLARALAGAAEAPAAMERLDRTLAADLRATLTKLVDQVSRQIDQPAARLPQEALRDLASVREHAQALIGRIELQQMTNAAATATPIPIGRESYLMFQVPIPGGQTGQSAQIRIRQNEGGAAKRIDPRNLQIVFQFEMQHLGTVRIGLRVLDRHVSCQMGSDDPGATELLRQHSDQLRDGLGGLGYTVDDLRCATLTADELRAKDEAAPAGPTRPPLRVDARA